MLKFGIKLLFVTFTHIIIATICAQFLETLKNAFLIYFTIIIEFAISIYFIYLGHDEKNNKKDSE